LCSEASHQGCMLRCYLLVSCRPYSGVCSSKVCASQSQSQQLVPPQTNQERTQERRKAWAEGWVPAHLSERVQGLQRPLQQRQRHCQLSLAFVLDGLGAGGLQCPPSRFTVSRVGRVAGGAAGAHLAPWAGVSSQRVQEELHNPLSAGPCCMAGQPARHVQLCRQQWCCGCSAHLLCSCRLLGRHHLLLRSRILALAVHHDQRLSHLLACKPSSPPGQTCAAMPYATLLDQRSPRGQACMQECRATAPAPPSQAHRSQ